MGEAPVLEAGRDGVGVLFICVTVNHEIVLVVRQDVVEGNRDRLFALGIESQAAGFERIVCDDLAGNEGRVVINAQTFGAAVGAWQSKQDVSRSFVTWIYETNGPARFKFRT